MKILEQFTRGKTGDEAANEDRVSVTDDFIAVFDGVTSRNGVTLKGLSTGKFAACLLAAELEKMPRESTAEEAVTRLNDALARETRAAAAAEGKAFAEAWTFPGAALLVYSRARKEIWRVADSTFVLDGRADYKTFPQERTWAQLRRAYLCAKIARGIPERELAEHDESWDLLAPMIAELKVFANYSGPFGYGVLNGSRVPREHIEVHPAVEVREIILASDGYPQVFLTLAETELHIQQVIAEDPLMYKVHPQVKGVKKGYVSFDDRSYIRFQP